MFFNHDWSWMAHIGVSVFSSNTALRCATWTRRTTVSFGISSHSTRIKTHLDVLQPPANLAKPPPQGPHPHHQEHRTNHNIPKHHVVIPPPVPKHLASHVPIIRPHVAQIPHRRGREIVFCQLGLARDDGEEEG
jgi:hypothetical protein